MWSFLYYDHKAQSIIYSRDRFGEKPLFKYSSDKYIIFSSEIMPICDAVEILEDKILKPKSDQIYNFIKFGNLSDKSTTPFSEISAIAPGIIGRIDLASFQIFETNFFTYNNSIKFDGSYEEALIEFSNIFESSVELRAQADVPVALALSGGLDSTCVLAALNKVLPRAELNCYTSHFENNESEIQWANFASEVHNNNLIPVNTRLDNWRLLVNIIQKRLGMPINSPAVIPHFNLMIAARKDGYKVILEGQGADELLGGYIHHHCLYLLSLFKKMKISQAFNFLWLALKLHGVILFCVTLLIFVVNQILSMIKLNRSTINIKNELLSDFSVKILPALLHYGDICSMTGGVENRNPFLDFRLVNFIHSLPEEFLFKDGLNKPILRDYLIRNGYLKNANRLDKKGYSLPYKSICKNNKIDFKISSDDITKYFKSLKQKKKFHIKIINLISKTPFIFGYKRSFFHLYKFISASAFLKHLNDNSKVDN